MATAFARGAGGLVIQWGAAHSAAAARRSVACAAPVRRRAVSCAAPSRPRHPPPLPLLPLVHARVRPPVRAPPSRCQPEAAPESPVEPPSFWQKVKEVWKRISWKSVSTLVLLIGCTVVGYFANKEVPWALFIVDVLDKGNKTYKPTLEFAVLLVAVIISLSSK